MLQMPNHRSARLMNRGRAPTPEPVEPNGGVVATTMAVAVAVDMEGYPSTWRIPRRLRRIFLHHHCQTWQK